MLDYIKKMKSGTAVFWKSVLFVVLSVVAVAGLVIFAGKSYQAGPLESYFAAKGVETPSYEERSILAAEFGIFSYKGTREENERLADILRKVDMQESGELLGFSVATRYRTTLQSSMTSVQTTIPVASLSTFDSHTLTMADLGAAVYLTVEPGSSREEIIKCTAISSSQWSSCTRGLAFYGTTETSVTANQKSHSAGSTVILSNVHYVYENLVDKDTSETLYGKKTFSTYPEIASYVAPTTTTQLAPKAYVDAQVSAGCGDSSSSAKGCVELATGAEAAASTASGSASVLAIPASIATSTPYTGGNWSIVSKVSGVIDHLFSHTADNFTYGDTISAGQPLYFDTADSKLKRADASVASTADLFVGISIDAGVDTDTSKRVQTSGIVTGLSGLTVGPVYISDTTGAFSSTAGTYKKMVGYAISSSALLLMPQERPVNLAGTSANVTATNLNTLTAGSTSNADTLHTHAVVKKVCTGVLDVNISDSTTETTVVSCTVPGGTLSTNNAIEFKLAVQGLDMLSGAQMTLRLKYGGSTITSHVIEAGGNMTSIVGSVEGMVIASSTASTQEGSVSSFWWTNGVAVNTSNGTTDKHAAYVTSGSSAVDSSSDQTFAITAQMSSASASNAVSFKHSLVKSVQ